jgi:hypothetical protein
MHIKENNKSYDTKIVLKNYNLPYFLRKVTQLVAHFDDVAASKIAERFGSLVWEETVHNLGTNVRLAVIAGLYGGTGSQTAFSYLALGTSNTAVAASQTALVAEITDSGLARASATMSRTTTNQTNDTTVFTKTWTATGSKTVEEIGYFNDPTTGVMGGRALTGTKSMVSGNTLTATYSVIHT